MNMEDPILFEFKQHYNMARSYIINEAELINNRITWMLTIHGFLYATYGFTLQKILEINEKIAATRLAPHDLQEYCKEVGSQGLVTSTFQSLFFLFCICVIGFTISLFANGSIEAAHNAINTIKKIFDEYKPTVDFEDTKVYRVDTESRSWMFPDVTGGGAPQSHDSGFVAAYKIPKLLMLGWFVSFTVLLFETNSEYLIFSASNGCT